MLRGRRAARRAEAEDQARMERYVAAWRRWFDRQAGHGVPAGSGGR
jgi:hypothetical protein